MDKDYPPRSGMLFQYAHLRGMAENMPVIRKLIGLPEYGRLPDTALGRTLQTFVSNSRENAVCESRTNIHTPFE